MTRQQMSETIYNIIYKNGKPEYKLSTEDFMQLLFISDELSDKPLLGDN